MPVGPASAGANAAILRGGVAGHGSRAGVHSARAGGAEAAALAAIRSATARGRVLHLFPARTARTRWGGEPAWAAAVLMLGDRRQAGSAVVSGGAAAPYEPGLLALREGPLLEAALRALPEPPEVVIANASGRDHPRGAGLALHLGAMLELPSVGVTDRPLLATGLDPGPERGATSGLMLDRTEVARRLRSRVGARPIVVHSGWRTDLDTAVSVVLASTRRARTPEPLRRARRAARQARADALRG